MANSIQSLELSAIHKNKGDDWDELYTSLAIMYKHTATLKVKQPLLDWYMPFFTSKCSSSTGQK